MRCVGYPREVPACDLAYSFTVQTLTDSREPGCHVGAHAVQQVGPSAPALRHLGGPGLYGDPARPAILPGPAAPTTELLM